MTKQPARRIVVSILVLAGFFLLVLTLKRCREKGQEPVTAVSTARLFHHIQYLASDELTGRLAGSPGAEKAADYIVRQFERDKLSAMPGISGFRQPFSFVAGIELGLLNSLTVDCEVCGSSRILDLGTEFMPAALSLSGDFDGPAVFGGYGISTPALKYDDYEGISVKDRFVFVLRYGPEGNNPHSQFSRQHALRYKALTAREKGARAIVFIDDQEDFSKSTLSRLRYDADFADSGIAALAVSLPTARKLFQCAGVDLSGLQQEINVQKRARSQELPGLQLSSHIELRKINQTTENVLGFLRGNDARLNDELLVLGAHYDHIGLGEIGSLAQKPGKAIHNGADDNASGTAGLLEAARVLSAQRARLKRSVAFIAFSGEEEGLLGSKHFISHMPWALDKMIAMINMDMIGRMKDNRLIIGGSGSSSGWRPLLEELNQHKLALRFDDDGFGPSDHSSFYARNIPVLFFFTGVHQDYHRPSDDSQKIDLPDTKRVLDLVIQTAVALSEHDEKPQFVASKEPLKSRERGEFHVYLGTIPEYGEEVEGVKLSGVREGSPAAKAGLKAGDIIVECAGKNIKNVYDYTFALGEKRAGDVIDIVVVRSKERVRLQAQLEQR